MKTPPNAQYDQNERIDRLVFRDHDRLTAGADALHSIDPAEMVMRMEEEAADPRILARREREAARVEVFSGFAEYLFADGPEPEAVRLRIEGFLISFQPEQCSKMRGAKEWVAPHEVAEVLRKYRRRLAISRAVARSRAALSTWAREMARELEPEFLAEIIAGLIAWLLSEGPSWKAVVSVAYGMAKAYRPHLIGGMSLEDIAILSGDKGGRATPSDRIKRLHNRRVAAGGAKACHVHFQKSASAVEQCSRSQQGNHNRRAKGRRRKP